MELLDIYDEERNHLGVEDRNVVHRDALWHNTVHCWLYDKEGNIFFQKRSDEGTLYTTASGHILAGETLTEGFGREIKEEIGIDVDYDKAVLVDVVKFVLDKVKKDGSLFRDRVFANVYVCNYDGDYSDFDFDLNELTALVKVNAKEAFDLFEKKQGEIEGTVISKGEHEIKVENRKIDFNEFLVNDGETALGKYGDVLKKVIELTK